MSPAAQRSWGFWTEAKLGILRSYLPAFLQASKGKATEFVYLDAFAGYGHGTSRLTGEAFSGSARIALDTDVAGGFTKLRYFERAGKAPELAQRLRTDYPGRDICQGRFKSHPSVPVEKSPPPRAWAGRSKTGPPHLG